MKFFIKLYKLLFRKQKQPLIVLVNSSSQPNIEYELPGGLLYVRCYSGLKRRIKITVEEL